MRVLDLYSGMKGWSEPFADRGHQVLTIDNDWRFDPDLIVDIGLIKPDSLGIGQWDLILASPPCTHFTVMSIGKHWTRDHQPKTPQAQASRNLVLHTVNLIEALRPRYWIMENPRAKLRRLMELWYPEIERRTVTYCHYGRAQMKPTDLWGVFPPSLELAPVCRNGDPCHTRAVRGSRTATQGMDGALAAKIPYDLAEAVCLAAERDLQ